MRQAGYLAAAGIYALDNHIDRLKIDNDNARKLGAILNQLPYVSDVRPIKTNILIFDLKPPFTSSSFIDELAKYQILAAPFGPQTVRFVTHLDVTPAMLDKVIDILQHNIAV